MKIDNAPRNEPGRQLYFIERAKEQAEALAAEKGRSIRYCLETFGCQMNEKQSEVVAGILDQMGYERRQVEEEADIILYNTCTVRENANQKVYGRLGRLRHLSKENPGLKVVLFGCMMQEKEVTARIEKDYAFVNLVFGTHNLFQFAELFYEMMQSQEQLVDVWEGSGIIVEDLPSSRNFSFKSGVNIMFGCDNFCSYCIVPYVRGREKSREAGDIVREVERLSREGVTEVMLLGQNVNSYGKNLSDPVSFSKLLSMVSQVEGIRRIRFMTSHPKDLSEDLIREIARNEKVCRHLHLPIQSGSSRILKQMNRHYTKEQYLDLVSRIRKAVPDISLTTDIMVGFPGETEEDFLETMDVVRQADFDTAFTFIYSKRTGTPAASREDQVPAEVVRERFDRLLALVQEKGREISSRFTGTDQEVLVETESKEEGILTGRLTYNLLVHFEGGKELLGQYVKVHLDECQGFYYKGSLIGRQDTESL